MILPDVNVLVYAFRQDMHQHALCRGWLVGILSSDAPFAISRLVLSAVVRITTNPRIFKMPSTIEEAFRFCNNLLSQPYCQLIEPGNRHWQIFQRLCRETDTRGSRITDVWFAALAIESGSEWITLDRDYARFQGLNWKMPALH